MRTIIAFALCVLAVSCNSQKNAVGTFPPDTPSPTPAPTPITVSGTKLFHTPTGNIGCVMSDAVAPASARCDIGDRTWKSPPKPADCPNDYGNGVEVSDKKGQFVCAGDTVLHQGDQIPYGQKLQLG